MNTATLRDVLTEEEQKKLPIDLNLSLYVSNLRAHDLLSLSMIITGNRFKHLVPSDAVAHTWNLFAFRAISNGKQIF